MPPAYGDGKLSSACRQSVLSHHIQVLVKKLLKYHYHICFHHQHRQHVPAPVTLCYKTHLYKFSLSDPPISPLHTTPHPSTVQASGQSTASKSTNLQQWQYKKIILAFLIYLKILWVKSLGSILFFYVWDAVFIISKKNVWVLPSSCKIICL